MSISDLDQYLEGKNLAGFWNIRAGSHRPEMPYLWKWNDVHEGLLRASDTIGFELAERRSIRLINPHSPCRSTSRTLQFSLSIVNPGEIARAHRHNMAAVRFVVQGHGACTVVEGERFLMEEGDLILTPNWTWHDHFNASVEPIIWLDGLDGPLVHTLNALFFEEYEKKSQSVVLADGDSTRRLGFARVSQRINSDPVGEPFRYSWGDTYRALQAIGDSEIDPYDGCLVQFVNPRSGGPTLATMSCEMQLLKPGQRTGSHRHTSSTLYHVFRGSGRTAVGEGFLQWQKGDSFVIPLWLWHHHENQSGNEALLFSVTDRPLMEAIGLYRAEG